MHRYFLLSFHACVSCVLIVYNRFSIQAYFPTFVGSLVEGFVTCIFAGLTLLPAIVFAGYRDAVSQFASGRQ